MNKTLGIIGAGHLGQQIAHYALSDKHYKKVCFFDDFLTGDINGNQILGRIDTVQKSFDHKNFDELLIGIGYKHMNVRKNLFDQFDENIPFGKMIHSSSWIDPTAQTGKGTVIYPSCTLDANSIIEDNVLLNINCSIAHDTKIGKHCFLSPRVALAGFIKVNEQCILGINSTIIDNIEIAEQIQIGAGTVVIKNLDKRGLYVGNPARFVR